MTVMTAVALPVAPVTPPALCVPVVIAGDVGTVHLPTGIQDLDSFRRWATSADFPKRGRFAFLQGLLWVDLTMEQLYTHNQVKTEVAGVLHPLMKSARQGRYLADGMLLSNPLANLSTVPDGVCVSYDAFNRGRVREVPGTQAGFVELEGSPDMVLEVVSESSIEKDMELLPQLYWLAGIREFWRIDARGPEVRFEILRHTPDGFVAVAAQDGWLFSEVFGRFFQFRQATDPRGRPEFTLEVRE